MQVEVTRMKQRVCNDLPARIVRKETDLYRLARQSNKDGEDVQ